MTSNIPDKSVLISRDGAVAVIRLNRPDRLNAVDEAMIAELRAALEAANLDPDVRAVMIIGSERSFMSGVDLTLFHQDLDRAPETAARLIDAFHRVLRSMRAMPKPVIAGLSGSIVGGGLGLALACDLWVMAGDARRGITKDGAKLIMAVAGAPVPKFTVVCNGSYGAGTYGMAGRAFDPGFMFTWPQSQVLVMGAEQAAGVLTDIKLRQLTRNGQRLSDEEFAAIRDPILQDYREQSSANYATLEIWDDGKIRSIPATRSA